jgi:hypothetical protein
MKTEVFKLEIRKDSAVHVSLSSSSLVKQPGSLTTPSPFNGSLSGERPPKRPF